MNEKGSRRLTLFRPDLTLASFEITGVFKPETDILTNDLIVMNIDDASDLFKIPDGMATDLCVYVPNLSEVSTIAKKIAVALPDARVVTRFQINQTYQVVFGWRSGFASVCLLTALAAFVILAWDKASGLSPDEKREIGVLKILGWETADILAVRFWEGFVVSGLAFILGCTLAYVHVAFFEAALFRPVLVGWSVIYPTLHLVPSFVLSHFLLVFCFSVLPYLAATVIPAWRSASVSADSALSGL
jgi:ABC-type lipoprotein release transport system permease subunit